MILRPYQSAASNAIFKEWLENDSTLVVMPTGGSKTILFADVIRRGRRREEIAFSTPMAGFRAGCGTVAQMAPATGWAERPPGPPAWNLTLMRVRLACCLVSSFRVGLDARLGQGQRFDMTADERPFLVCWRAGKKRS